MSWRGRGGGERHGRYSRIGLIVGCVVLRDPETCDGIEMRLSRGKNIVAQGGASA